MRLSNSDQTVVVGIIAMLCLPACRDEPPRMELTDSAIATAVQNELAYDRFVPATRIKVTTHNGIVTLSGWVDNLIALERAPAVAGTVRGVRSVVNRLALATVARSDAELVRDVEDALAADAATDAFEIETEVDSGRVTLSGQVDSYQEKLLAERVAKGVRGVREVRNRLKVAFGALRTDAEITNDVRAVLQWDMFVDDALINVETKDGDVVLTGAVGSAAEKARADRDAWVGGVRSVDASRLEVRAWAREAHGQVDKFAWRPDSAIRVAVIAALAQDPRVHAFQVDVAVSDGAVSLAGEVDNLKAKRAAGATAANTTGVISVHNQLEVRSKRATGDDDDIAKRVRSALMRDPFVERYEVSARVDSGIVHLSGTVDTPFEKAQAEDVVSRIRGVVAVDNELSVLRDSRLTPNPYVDDWLQGDFNWYVPSDRLVTVQRDKDILRQIRFELEWSPFVDANEVTVSVSKGVATLTGTVDSVAECLAARENAFEGGAVAVRDHLRVE